MRYCLSLVVSLAALVLARGEAWAQEFDRQQALTVSQAAIGKLLGDHAFRDTQGVVKLSDLRGKPLVLSFVYSSCYHTCPVTTSYLRKVVRIAREALGETSFNVATIGFDVPNDSPARMADFARQHGIDEPGWVFLSGDSASIEALTRVTGFQYFPSPRGFDHLVQATVVDADGRVYRQVYGETFEAPALVEPLKQLLIDGRSQPSALAEWANDVRLFCTVYDASSGRYQFDYSVVVLIIVGTLCLGGIGVWLVQAWRETSRTRAPERPLPPAGNSREHPL